MSRDNRERLRDVANELHVLASQVSPDVHEALHAIAGALQRIAEELQGAEERADHLRCRITWATTGDTPKFLSEDEQRDLRCTLPRGHVGVHVYRLKEVPVS